MIQVNNSFLTPNVDPVEKGYMWGKWQIPQVMWNKYNIINYGINAIYICTSERIYRELYSNQIKQNIAFEQAFFYIYPSNTAFGYYKNQKSKINANRIMRQSYVFEQLGKFRAYDAHDKMVLNLDALSLLFPVMNPAINNFDINSTSFEDLPQDNDFTARLTSRVTVTGIIKMPLKNC